MWQAKIGTDLCPTFNTLDEAREYVRRVVGNWCNVWLDTVDADARPGRVLRVTNLETGAERIAVYLRDVEGGRIALFRTYGGARRAYYNDRIAHGAPTAWRP